MRIICSLPLLASNSKYSSIATQYKKNILPNDSKVQIFSSVTWRLDECFFSIWRIGAKIGPIELIRRFIFVINEFWTWGMIHFELRHFQYCRRELNINCFCDPVHRVKARETRNWRVALCLRMKIAGVFLLTLFAFAGVSVLLIHYMDNGHEPRNVSFGFKYRCRRSHCCASLRLCVLWHDGIKHQNYIPSPKMLLHLSLNWTTNPV